MKSNQVSAQPSVEPAGAFGDIPALNPDQAVVEAKGLIVRLNAAIKSFSIYPKNHAVSRKYLQRLEDGLESTLSQFDVLRFFVDKGKLFFKNVQVHEDAEQENNIAYLLSRDGVKWFEFHKGIQQGEIESFIDIFNAYRVLTPISDGDIVTALWEMDFPHVKYEAVDLVLKNGPPLDLNEYKTVDPEKLESGEEKERGDAGEEGGQHTSGQSPERDQGKQFPLMVAGKELWGLTENEEQYLQKLVHEVENEDSTGSVSEVLMLSMMMQNNEQDFVNALHFLQDRLINTFRMGKYKTSYVISINIKKLRKILTAKRKWTLPLFQDFIATVSSSKCFSTLPRFLNEEWDKSEGGCLKYLWPALRLLNGDVLTVLCPLILKIDSGRYQQSFYKIIKYHAERNVEIFMNILPSLDKRLILQLIPVIGMMKKHASAPILLKLAKYESVEVRNRASRKLLSSDPRLVNKILFLLDDPDEMIRKRVLMYLSQDREREREKYLQRYFHRINIHQHDPKHILGCYETLGLCGSEESIPFLEKILFEKSLKNLFQYKAGLHKKGAARALQALELVEADRILRKGRRSFFPSIRSSCKNALRLRYESSQ